MAYSEEQRRSALETFIRFDHSYADTIAELGYPNRGTLRGWWREYERTGVVPVRKSVSDPTYTDAMKRAAVDHYLGHGRSLARTARALGYPKSRQLLGEWIDEYAPGQRKRRGPGPDRGPVPLERKVQVVAELEARTGTAAEVAERNGVSRAAPYAWRREIMGHNGGRHQEKGLPVAKEIDELPDGIGQLQDMLREAKARLRQVQLELDVREATLEIVKKDPGTDPNRLTNREKASMVEALRGRWSLRELLAAVGMAKSSYEYAKGALARGEGPERAAAREAVRAASGKSGGTYGYRRIYAQASSGAGPDAGIGERAVRSIMRQEGLAARTPKRRRRYSSYAGEISEAPGNLLRDGDGKRHFGADRPNELWVTDVTEFRIPAGKACLSPIVDCSGGMPISWPSSTSPDAEMANSSLLGACRQLRGGEHPKVHSDRGLPLPLARLAEDMRGARAGEVDVQEGVQPGRRESEGFFGRPRVEFFYGQDWSGVTMEEFIGRLDAYLSWYRDGRLKSDLGYMSPAQYRRSLGLAA